MTLIIIFLIIIIIALILMIMYISAHNVLSDISYKIKTCDDNIKEALNQKHELMKKLAEMIKKVCKKKDYLKDFSEIEKHNYNNYDLDKELDEAFNLMLSIQDDYKSLKTDEFNNIVEKINDLDQNIIANKKFFNKNNNKLIKELKGYYKEVAKLSKIKIKPSYEIKKEPKED